MKLVNHHKNNYTYDDTKDGSVMGGTIYMTAKEQAAAFDFLFGVLNRAVKNDDTYIRDSLTHTINTIKRHPNCRRLCYGVCATELIAARYGLKGYKKQNYVISLTK